MAAAAQHRRPAKQAAEAAAHAPVAADTETQSESEAEEEAMQHTPVQAGSVRRGDLIVVRGRPCRVLEVHTSKTGKHGHAKAHFVCSDVFTGRRAEHRETTHHTVPQPASVKEELRAVRVACGEACAAAVAGADGAEHTVRVLDADVAARAAAAIAGGKAALLTVLRCMGEEAIVHCRVKDAVAAAPAAAAPAVVAERCLSKKEQRRARREARDAADATTA